MTGTDDPRLIPPEPTASYRRDLNRQKEWLDREVSIRTRWYDNPATVVAFFASCLVVGAAAGLLIGAIVR